MTQSSRSEASLCDVVVPVHGSFDAVDDCLRSVLAYTSNLSRLIVIDDGSDEYVAAELDRYAHDDRRVTVIHLEHNVGFVRASNRGLHEADAPFVCLLNSDTVVTPGWLEAMVRCAAADSSVAVVNPLSNAAVNLTVQIAPGLDVFTMAHRVAKLSRRTYPDVVTAVGFCFLLTREAIERFGGFDEIYGAGYCEESDYCMRVTGAGRRVVVADDAFVFHRGGATFGRSRERYLRNRRLFDERWADRYAADYDDFMRRNPLQYIRDALESQLDDRGAVASTASASPSLTPAARLWVMTQDAWHKGGALGLLRKIRVAPLRLAEAVRSLRASRPSDDSPQGPADDAPKPFVDPEQRRLRFATPAYVRGLPRGRGMRSGVLIWRFDVCGGVLAVVDIINRLILEGHTVVVATLDDREMDAAFSLYARPLVFRSVEDLASGLPELDVVVATFWPTAAAWLPAIRRQQPDLASVYFVQDYEAWFIPDDEPVERSRVVDSYREADLLITTTEWLQGKLAAHGIASEVVPIGIDPRVFYPRQENRAGRVGGRKRILVPARPFAPWRGFTEALAVLGRVMQRRDDVDVVFFGCSDQDLASQSIPFRYENAGVVFDRQGVARLYAAADILFDPSLYQAFGLPGLEAMACGVAAILPLEGGGHIYAKNGRNALVVSSVDRDGRVAAIEKLVDDATLIASLCREGLATAAEFTVEHMVIGHLESYRRAAAARRTLEPMAPGS